MTWWIWNNWQDKYSIKVVFANTGDEHLATLIFVHWFEYHYNIPVTWIETEVYNERKASGFQIVDIYNCSRRGEPFDLVTAKYGLHSPSSPHCTRELKQNPITAYANFIFGGEPYCTAIGIRSDEIDRMSRHRKQKMILYPLISDRPMTKPKINFWWANQPFRLFLKGYQGNCKACFKKSDQKLYKIAQENTSSFIVSIRLEKKFSKFVPASRVKLMTERGENTNVTWKIYRNNRTAEDIILESKVWNGTIIDDHKLRAIQMDLLDLFDNETESCEVFSQCGTDN